MSNGKLQTVHTNERVCYTYIYIYVEEDVESLGRQKSFTIYERTKACHRHEYEEIWYVFILYVDR